MTAAELARLDRALASVPAADRDWVRGLAEPRWLRRQRALAARDRAVKAARIHCPEPQPCCAAKGLARGLRAYLTTGWLRERERLSEGANAYRAALREILTANDGKALSWRRILEIWQA
jgi:hypothetical protein